MRPLTRSMCDAMWAGTEYFWDERRSTRWPGGIHIDDDRHNHHSATAALNYCASRPRTVGRHEAAEGHGEGRLDPVHGHHRHDGIAVARHLCAIVAMDVSHGSYVSARGSDSR